MVHRELYNVHICIIRGLIEQELNKMKTERKIVQEQKLSERYRDIVASLTPICNEGSGVITVQPTPDELL